MRAQFLLIAFAAVGMTAPFAVRTAGVSVDNVREDSPPSRST